MKTLWKIIRTFLIILLVLILLLAGYFVVATNAHFLVDFRKNAAAPNGYDATITRTADGVRVELWSLDVRDREMQGMQVTYPFVVFNEDREVVRAVGCDPIDFDRRNLWGLWSYEDFLAEYGGPHGEVPSSGINWPIWITDDGYMITIWGAGEKSWITGISNIGEVRVYDLLATPE